MGAEERVEPAAKMNNPVTNLSQWLVDSCSKAGFADMHIDRFDPIWRDRSRWVEGGISVLQEAEKTRTLTHCNRKLAMVYSLQSGIEPNGVDFETAEEFQKQLDHSPPSLFIAESGSEPWITSQAYESVQVFSVPENVAKKIFPVHLSCESLLMQYRPDDREEASRTVWFLP